MALLLKGSEYFPICLSIIMVLFSWCSAPVARQAELSVHLLPQQQHGRVISKGFFVFFSPPWDTDRYSQTSSAGVEQVWPYKKDRKQRQGHTFQRWRTEWTAGTFGCRFLSRKTPIAVSTTTKQLFFSFSLPFFHTDNRLLLKKRCRLCFSDCLLHCSHLSCQHPLWILLFMFPRSEARMTWNNVKWASRGLLRWSFCSTVAPKPALFVSRVKGWSMTGISNASLINLLRGHKWCVDAFF